MDVRTAFPVGSWVLITCEKITTLARVRGYEYDSLVVVDERNHWTGRWQRVGVHQSYCKPVIPTEEEEATWLIHDLSR